MEVGQNIKVKGFNGEVLIRRVVQFSKDTIYICKDEEYRKALAEKREPVSVGFNIKYVVREES